MLVPHKKFAQMAVGGDSATQAWTTLFEPLSGFCKPIARATVFVTASQGKRTADDERFLDPLNKANKNIKLLATESQA